ncbi:unnamed protein product [marine sediment metagenome]|uniref:Uncharacterized protein n=1 Tax=marine sediment metagenome TaxID=412755 RepID=X1G1D6_9ZZZZ
MKFGALVVAGRGKIGGHVLSRNRAGAYLRTKVTPVNPSSGAQVDVRNRFSGISSDWKGLTAAQRLAWNAAVSDFAKTDIFGDLRNPTGFNLHQKLNNNLVNIAKAQIADPPGVEAVDAFLTMSIAASTGGGTLAITYTDAIAADHSAIVFATPALSPGVSFVKSEYRQIDVMIAADVTPFAIAAEYEAKFGAIGAEGMKIFVKMVLVNWATGQAGIPMSASCLIAA